ncbi:hypothetical protein ABIC83_002527 [Roseateles asaccharophilus]|uniref:hypothetical protein n=1 Tax=Roseateles asaccharophilus TaxID=582607 RepID=UPI00383383B6
MNRDTTRQAFCNLAAELRDNVAMEYVPVEAALRTYLIFTWSILLGVLAYFYARRYGANLPRWSRVVLQVNFGLCVAMAAWGCIAWGLWAMGVELHIVAIKAGTMEKGVWLGPAAALWGAFTFWQLKLGSRRAQR